MAVDIAPYDRLGNLMHFPAKQWHYDRASPEANASGFVILPPEWRENTPFQAKLTLVSHNRGRSAAYFIWKDEEEHTFPMFMTDLGVLLSTSSVSQGETALERWNIKKRGQNYGVGLYND